MMTHEISVDGPLRETYLCGPTGMTASVIKTLRALGVPRRHIHHESFEF